MANLNKAFGLDPVSLFNSAEKAATQYAVTAAVAVNVGDLLKIVAAGTVERGAAGIGADAIGAAMGYVGASDADRNVMVWDDPDIIFKIQSGGTPAATDIGTNADHVAGTAVTASGFYYPTRSGIVGLSTDYLSGTMAAAAAQLRVLGLAPIVNNAWGQYAILLVKFNEHKLLVTTGV